MAAVDGQGEFIESYLYELTDHLGNVRATLKDNYNGNGILNSYADYYPMNYLATLYNALRNSLLLIIGIVVTITMTYFFVSHLLSYKKCKIRIYTVQVIDYQLVNWHGNENVLEFRGHSHLKWHLLYFENEKLIEEIRKHQNIQLEVNNCREIIKIKSDNQSLFDQSIFMRKNFFLQMGITGCLIIIGVWIFLRTLKIVRMNNSKNVFL